MSLVNRLSIWEKNPDLNLKQDIAEQLYQSSPKTFNLMGRSTNHGQNLKTNTHLIITHANLMMNLHFQRRKTSVTKLKDLKCNE
jgi:hypothetical protein